MAETFPSAMYEPATGFMAIRPVLGLTAYLAEPDFWAAEGARKVLDAFLKSPRAENLQWFTTSAMTEWRPVSDRGIAELRSELNTQLLVSAKSRHLFFLKLNDVTNCPNVGFSYTEIDSQRATRSAVIELSFWFDAPPAELFQMAMEIAHTGPLHSLVGGYAARWSVLFSKMAFTEFHIWSHRWLGLDIQDAELHAWQTPEGLPGSNWLTLVGDRLAPPEAIDLDALAGCQWEQPGVTSIRTPNGVLVRAGERPTLGDINELSYPRAYAEVARALHPWFIQEPKDFWGPFTDDGSTAIWMKRLVDAGSWSEMPGVDLNDLNR